MNRYKIGRGVLISVLLWWVISMVTGRAIVPTPWQTAVRFVELFPDQLWKHTLASLGRVGGAVGGSALLAIPLGIVMGRNRRIDAVIAPVSYLFYPIPKIAFLPVFMLLLGIGNTSKIVVVLLVLFFQMLLAVRDGASHVPPSYIVSIRSLGAEKKDVLRYVIWPFLLPRIMTSLRIGIGTALAVLFFAETFFTDYGLGFFIVDSWMRISYPDMFAGILMLSITGFGLFISLDVLERSLCPWKEEEKKEA